MTWYPNSELELEGYTVYYGNASGDYYESITVGNDTTCTVTGLADGKTYFFAVAAYDANGEESELSQEVSFTVGYAPERIYEDAEDGTVMRWEGFTSNTPEAMIDNIFDITRESRVIELSGCDTDNGYRLRSEDLVRWRNTDQFVIEWSMRCSEFFTIYIDVETTVGHRFLVYQPVDYDELGSDHCALFGLGTRAKDGTWHTYVRDLRADLDLAQPGQAGFLCHICTLLDAHYLCLRNHAGTGTKSPPRAGGDLCAGIILFWAVSVVAGDIPVVIRHVKSKLASAWKEACTTSLSFIH